MSKTEKQDSHVVHDDVVKTKDVRNRSGHRIELVINDKVVVFLPGKITKVPFDFIVPNGLGLYVR